MRVPDPWIFKCQPGSAGSDNVLAPRNIICHPPHRRVPPSSSPSLSPATSIVDSQEGRNTRRAFPGSRVDLSIADLFIPTRLNDSITDRRSEAVVCIESVCDILLPSSPFALSFTQEWHPFLTYRHIFLLMCVCLKMFFGLCFVHGSFTLYCRDLSFFFNFYIYEIINITLLY